MKLSSSSTTTTLFTLFLLSAAITTSHLPSAAAADLIYDQDGQPLRNGGAYYIVPAFRGVGGGVTLDKTGNETCPVSVVQAPFETSRGLPVRISSPYRIAYIYDGVILSFSFTSVPDCAPTPSSWTVVKAPPEELSVKLSGYDDPVDGWFNIASHSYYRHDYTIKFCAASSDECGDIAVDVDDNGVRNLVVIDDNSKSNSPFIVQFRKARHHHHAFADDA